MDLEVRTPVSLRKLEARKAFEALDADVAIVVAYGLILGPKVLAAPRHGCLNLHGSLLPRWRGAAPIQRAIMAGDKAIRDRDHAHASGSRHRPGLHECKG